jgi:hypothetical protein
MDVLLGGVGVLAAGLIVGATGVVWHIRRRHMHRWLPAYLRE